MPKPKASLAAAKTEVHESTSALLAKRRTKTCWPRKKKQKFFVFTSNALFQKTQNMCWRLNFMTSKNVFFFEFVFQMLTSKNWSLWRRKVFENRLTSKHCLASMHLKPWILIASYFCAAQGSESISKKTFKLTKIREDSSDFDDFWTELIALAWAIISKVFLVCRWAPIAKKFRKKFADHVYGS